MVLVGSSVSYRNPSTQRFIGLLPEPLFPLLFLILSIMFSIKIVRMLAFMTISPRILFMPLSMDLMVRRLHTAFPKRRKLHNQIEDAKGSIRVFCRCRPLSKTESSTGCSTVVDFDIAANGEPGVLNSGSTKKTFRFDRVFTPNDNQVDVSAQALPLVTSVLDGYNVCIFAYGQTGTGKTFTMEAVSGIKRPRITVDEQQASVHVTYNSITRESKRKLEEFLQKWSEWHARHPSKDPEVELESGEGTYFPALTVGPDKPSSVSFWIDGQPRNLQNKEVMELDNSSIPLYDRGYSFGLTSTDGSSNLDGGLEIVDGARCFNCGSYSHALKECPKPRDNAAVNIARKQHKTKRNQNAMSRNPTRYYQDTPGGKFDGLRPGVLDSETKKLLGLGELDPPPWLNRMREIGYPPGYLDAEDEEEPSGIEIIGDEVVVVKQETEDGEILDMDISPPPVASEPPKPELPKKMSVQFPGVNAPIPENADEWRWGARAWKFDLPRNISSDHRSYNPIERSIRSNYHEERWNRDYRDDGPPGVEPASGSLPSSFSPRYPGYDSRGSSHGRSLHDRDRRSPLIRETSSSHDVDRWNPYSSDYLSHRNNRHEDRHRRSWR